MRVMTGLAITLAVATASCTDDSPTEPNLAKEGLDAAKAAPVDSTTPPADSGITRVPMVSAIRARGGVVSTVCLRQQKALRGIEAARARDPKNADLATKVGELSAVVEDVCN